MDFMGGFWEAAWGNNNPAANNANNNAQQGLGANAAMGCQQNAANPGQDASCCSNGMFVPGVMMMGFFNS